MGQVEFYLEILEYKSFILVRMILLSS